MKFAMLPPSAIEILRDERQRREVQIDDLLPSVERRGIITPIIVERRGPEGAPLFRLVAGERRLTCALHLGLAEIPVRFLDELPEDEAKAIELEENIKRADLPWGDIVRSIRQLHDIYCRQTPGWLASQTAEAISITKGYLSMALRVARDLDDPRVAGSGTIREAYNLLLRRDERAEAKTLDGVLGDKGPAEGRQQDLFEKEAQEGEGAPGEGEGAPGEGEGAPGDAPRDANPASHQPRAIDSGVVCGDFREWVAQYSGPKFNLIHCDFPYGIELFSSKGIRTGEGKKMMGWDEGETYGDSPEDFQNLLEVFLENFDRFASRSCHLVFWFSNKFEIESHIRRRFATLLPEVEFSRYPLVWMKSDNTGIAAIPQRELRHVYEVALFGSRGERPIVRVKSDCFACPTEKSLHPSAKPPQMLRHFFEALVDEHTTLFDPTCGSGYALQAAEALGAKHVLGLELDPRMAEMAGRALEVERRKREAARLLGGG